MLEICAKDEFVKDLTFPEALELSNAYADKIKKKVDAELGQLARVHDFINLCEEYSNQTK